MCTNTFAYGITKQLCPLVLPLQGASDYVQFSSSFGFNYNKVENKAIAYNSRNIMPLYTLCYILFFLKTGYCISLTGLKLICS